jgi:hypothetical protein
MEHAMNKVEQIDQILTIADVAADLRCSRAHAAKLILGTVRGVSPLPAISIGRRKLVRRSTLEAWKVANEHAAGGILQSSPEVAAA